MSFGMMKAGIQVLAGIDNDLSCKETYEINNKPSKFLHEDIADLSPGTLSEILHIKKDDDELVFIGCSPCQFWSKINTDKTKSQKTAFLLKEFQKFVDWFNPGFVVIENVPGLMSKTKQTILPEFLSFLDSKRYSYDFDIINSKLHGVPQNRKRYLLVASRLVKNMTLPKPVEDKNLTVRNFIGEENGFPKIKAGHKDPSAFIHSAAALSENNLKRMKKTRKDGGTRDGWKKDPELQIPAYEGKDNIFKNVYGRLFWDQPASTITTRFNSFSNGRFGHPEQDRAISLREGATLQTFPKNYIFKASNQSAIARQIGNAVPPALAEKVGRHLIGIYNHGNI